MAPVRRVQSFTEIPKLASPCYTERRAVYEPPEVWLGGTVVVWGVADGGLSVVRGVAGAVDGGAVTRGADVVGAAAGSGDAGGRVGSTVIVVGVVRGDWVVEG